MDAANKCHLFACVAQGTERRSSEPGVGSSNLSAGTKRTTMTEVEQMLHNIDQCKEGTWYKEEQINNMKLNASNIYSLLKSIEGTTYVYKDTDREGKPREREVVIRFGEFRFGHNDMMVYEHSKDALLTWSLKEIFDTWKMEKKIHGYGGNGWGTAFVFGYEPWSVPIIPVKQEDVGLKL